jgi:hypothetical protein
VIAQGAGDINQAVRMLKARLEAKGGHVPVPPPSDAGFIVPPNAGGRT